MITNLHKLAKTCLGVSRERKLTATNYDGLTIILGDARSGKNILLTGLTHASYIDDNFLVLTETLLQDNLGGMLSNTHITNVIQDYREFNIDNVLMYLEGIDQQNIFIEQYNGSSKSDDEKLKDLIALKQFCKDTGKNIYMCVSNRRIKM